MFRVNSFRLLVLSYYTLPRRTTSVSYSRVCQNLRGSYHDIADLIYFVSIPPPNVTPKNFVAPRGNKNHKFLFFFWNRDRSV